VRIFICYAVHVYLWRRTCVFVTPYMFICYAVHVYLLRRTCLFVTPYMFICYAVHVYLLRRICLFVTPYMFIFMLKRYTLIIFSLINFFLWYWFYLEEEYCLSFIDEEICLPPFWLGLVRSAWWISCTKALLCWTLENRHLNRAINKLVLAMIY
jgi:hypothetical protein